MSLRVVGSDSDVARALKEALKTAEDCEATSAVVVLTGRDGPITTIFAGPSVLTWLGLIEIARQVALEQATE